MPIIEYARREFIARYLADISKAICVVGLASKFFLDLPLGARIVLGLSGMLLFILAIVVQPEKEGGLK